MTRTAGTSAAPRAGSRGKLALWALLAVGLVLAAHYFDAPVPMSQTPDRRAQGSRSGPPCTFRQGEVERMAVERQVPLDQ